MKDIIPYTIVVFFAIWFWFMIFISIKGFIK